MQVKELEVKGLKNKFKVTVEAAKIDAQTEAELKAAGERVKIPGFRPGLIPMKVLKQRFGKTVQADVLKSLINSSTTDAIRQKKLRPATTPQVNIEDYKEGGDLVYTMEFEAFPDVPEFDFTKITLPRDTFEIADADIDEAGKRIAERSPRLARAKEGTRAAIGQVVTIDFKGSLNGEAFEGGSAENFKLELGSHQFIEGFEEQLAGAKEGDDKIVTVTFPKDYPSANLAGKEAQFSVHVREIHDKETPAIDEEFARSCGLADLAAFREAIRSQLIREYDSIVRNRLKKDLFDKLDAQCSFELPQGMVEAEFNAIWGRLKQAMEQGDPELAGKDEGELKKEYQEIAHRRVKLGILLAETGNRAKVQVTDQELGQAVMQQASQFPGQEKQVLEFYRNHPERTEDLRGPILEEKVVDYILTKVKYDDRKVEAKSLAEDESEAPEKKPSKSKAKKK